jgi:hypothetical protein
MVLHSPRYDIDTYCILMPDVALSIMRDEYKASCDYCQCGRGPSGMNPIAVHELTNDTIY